MKNPNGLKVGDVIYVEQAWEDEAGYYHDELAKVVSIDAEGIMTLEFLRRARKSRTG